jgi:cellulose biosynthesis protein BcsQ
VTEPQKRASAKRLSIVNHKGGVGKTTLTFNIATQLAVMGKRVLLVDADPQCNLTAYVIDGEVLDDLLDHSDDKDGETLASRASGGLGRHRPAQLHGSVRQRAGGSG